MNPTEEYHDLLSKPRVDPAKEHNDFVAAEWASFNATIDAEIAERQREHQDQRDERSERHRQQLAELKERHRQERVEEVRRHAADRLKDDHRHRLMREAFDVTLREKLVERKKSMELSPEESVRRQIERQSLVREMSALDKLRQQFNLASDTNEGMVAELEFVVEKQWKHRADETVQKMILKLQQAIRDLGGTPDPRFDLEYEKKYQAWKESNDDSPMPRRAEQARAAVPTTALTDADMDNLLSDAPPNPQGESEHDEA